jgi:hypothetical protein
LSLDAKTIKVNVFPHVKNLCRSSSSGKLSQLSTKPYSAITTLPSAYSTIPDVESIIFTKNRISNGNPAPEKIF